MQDAERRVLQAQEHGRMPWAAPDTHIHTCLLHDRLGCVGDQVAAHPQQGSLVQRDWEGCARDCGAGNQQQRGGNATERQPATEGRQGMRTQHT
eukprot:364918-Chlamydomonas_euryale.AAC.16